MGSMSDSFSSPVEPLASGKQSCQPAHLVSSAAPTALGFPSKALNVTSVQASWELPLQLGSIQGFRLFHHKLPAARFEGPCFWLALSVPFSTQVWVRPGTVLCPYSVRSCPGTERPSPDSLLPIFCPLQSQPPALRSSSRPSVAMGMASAVPMLSLGTTCPWTPLGSGIQ